MRCPPGRLVIGNILMALSTLPHHALRKQKMHYRLLIGHSINESARQNNKQEIRTFKLEESHL